MCFFAVLELFNVLHSFNLFKLPCLLNSEAFIKYILLNLTVLLIGNNLNFKNGFTPTHP